MFTIGLFTIMFLIIPLKRIQRFLSFGLCLGFVQAIILNWITTGVKKLYYLRGDKKVLGIPVFTALSWISPTIFFAHYFPRWKSWFYKVGYITFFAAGTTLVQYLQDRIGMWKNLKWSALHTFFLSILTHSLMTLSLPHFGCFHESSDD